VIYFVNTCILFYGQINKSWIWFVTMDVGNSSLQRSDSQCQNYSTQFEMNISWMNITELKNNILIYSYKVIYKKTFHTANSLPSIFLQTPSCKQDLYFTYRSRCIKWNKWLPFTDLILLKKKYCNILDNSYPCLDFDAVY
jgi:hypothetical protein